MSSSAARALRILEMVGRADQPPGVTEIARELGLAPGTAFRGLDALCRAGLVARHQSSSRYVLGPTAEHLRHSLIAQFPIRDIAIPHLIRLAAIGGETASLTVRLGWYALRVATVPGSNEITNAPPVGETSMLGNMYAGKAILAFLPPGAIADYRIWAKRHGQKPETTATELDAIGKAGFAPGALFADGRAALAVPLSLNGEAIAALALDGPVIAPGAPRGPILTACREAARALEAIARVQPALFDNPFGHIAPGGIAL